MPNTRPPLTDAASLSLAQAAARSKARCDYGLHLGAGSHNIRAAAALAPSACGLKMYLDQTYGPLRLEGLGALRSHMSSWPADRPLMAHAEGPAMAALLFLVTLRGRPLHLCHVSRREEILLIRAAKERGLPVTCEVTPHHLTLTEEDLPALGAGRGEVRPRLATRADREALWDNLDVVDCFATDHAPHTLAEKDGDQPPPGFPGLETALGLLLLAVHEGRLSREDLIVRMHHNPRRIFGLPEQPDTWIEVDEDAVWEVRASELRSRCGWSPFEGMLLRGRVRSVTLRDQPAFEDGQVLSAPGMGRDLAPAAQMAPVS